MKRSKVRTPSEHSDSSSESSSDSSSDHEEQSSESEREEEVEEADDEDDSDYAEPPKKHSSKASSSKKGSKKKAAPESKKSSPEDPKTSTEEPKKRTRKVAKDLFQLRSDALDEEAPLSDGRIVLPDGTQVWISNGQCEHCLALSIPDDPVYCWFEVGKMFTTCWQCGRGHGNTKAGSSDSGTGCTAGKTLRTKRLAIRKRLTDDSLPKVPDSKWCRDQQDAAKCVISIDRLIERSEQLNIQRKQDRLGA